MKKILILVIALALVGGVAMAQVTVGGIVEMRTQNNFDDTFTSTMGDTRLVVQGSVDEYNTVYMRLPAIPGAGTGVAIDRAHVTTNLGALAGTDEMGLGITVNWGWNEWSYADFVKFTGYEFEQVRVGKATTQGAKFNFNVMQMANIYFAVAMNAANLEEVTNILVGADATVDVGVGALSIEAVYGSLNVADIGDGQFGVGVKLAGIEVADGIALTTGGSYTHDLSDAEIHRWGFGLGADYASLAGLGVSMGGYLGEAEDMEFDHVGINLRVTPLDFLRFDIGSTLGLSDYYENAFDSLDVSVTVNAGRAAFRFGYLHIDEDNLANDAVLIANDVAIPMPKRDLRSSTGAHEGFYIRATLSF